MFGLSIKLVMAYELYVVSQALFFGFATAYSSRTEQAPESRRHGGNLVFVLAFAASIAALLFIPYFAFKYTFSGALVLLVLSVATVGAQRALALWLADRLSLNALGVLGFFGMLWGAAWVIEALPHP